jgi:hypothetical protein
MQAIVLGVQKDEALLWEVARESGIMSKVMIASADCVARVCGE